MTNYIIRNTINELNFTLNESVTIENPIFILRVQDKVIYNHKDIVLGEDFSWNKDRFNQFMITEVDEVNENLSEGRIYLPIAQYNFYVYQCQSNEITDNDLIIESGQIIVK